MCKGMNKRQTRGERDTDRKMRGAHVDQGGKKTLL